MTAQVVLEKDELLMIEWALRLHLKQNLFDYGPASVNKKFKLCAKLRSKFDELTD